MTSIEFNEVFQRFSRKAKALSFLNLSDIDITDDFYVWLKSTSSIPYVRRLFSKFSIDIDSEEISYELKYKLDEDMDYDFVVEILSLGCVAEWLEPYMNNEDLLNIFIASSGEKFYSQQAHATMVKEQYESMVRKQRHMIRDRGYINNSYLDGGY